MKINLDTYEDNDNLPDGGDKMGMTFSIERSYYTPKFFNIAGRTIKIAELIEAIKIIQGKERL